MAQEVDPDLVWGPAVGKTGDPKLFCGIEECKPWTKSEELPGRSYKTTYKLSHPPLHTAFEYVEKTSDVQRNTHKSTASYSGGQRGVKSTNQTTVGKPNGYVNSNMYPLFGYKNILEKYLIQTKPLTLPRESMVRDFRYNKLQYDTSYKKAYKYKVNYRGLTDTPNVPHAIRYNLNYQWLDKLRTFPPCKMDPGISEMKHRYKFLTNTAEGPGVLSDLRPSTICQINAPGKEAQEKTKASINCIQKIMDPYISTMQYDYVYFEPDQVKKYKHCPARPIQIFENKQVYDECFLGQKFMDRFIRRKIPTVPHRGMQSETQERYQLPLDELAHKKLHICSMPKFKPLTKGEVLAIPGMYHTDYAHIGHNWPLYTVV